LLNPSFRNVKGGLEGAPGRLGYT